MEILLSKELSKNSYILTSRKAFFHRFCDSGFKTKWCGFWSDIKFIDYFAFKIGDTWLSPQNCSSFNYKDISSTHSYKINDLIVEEFIFIPENRKSLVCMLLVKNSSPVEKEFQVSMELGVNIRKREEGWHDRSYGVKILEEGVLVSSQLGSLAFGSLPKGSLHLSSIYRDHYPSGEKHRCFIPGNYFVHIKLEPNSEKPIFFLFSVGLDENECMNNYKNTLLFLPNLYVEKESSYEKLLRNMGFNSNIEFLNELFYLSAMNLEKLAFESGVGFGYFAGLPWFTQFWGRDLGWMIPAIVEMGYFEEAKETLKTLLKFQSQDGEIPGFITPDGKASYNSIDSTPLFISSFYHYITNSGDLKFLEENIDKVLKAIGWCKMQIDSRGFIRNSGKTTWMDTLDRNGFPLEVQVFWIDALKSLSGMLRLLGDLSGSRMARNEAKKVEKNLEKFFWNEERGIYFDRINEFKDEKRTVNIIFPLFFGVSQNPEKILKILESEEFSSPYGVRTLSKNELNFNPAGYHTGSSWGWITGLLACVELRYKRPEKALEYLKILYNRIMKSCIGCIGEAWNSETGEDLLQKKEFFEEGCLLQGWSSSLVIRCVDEFMLGLSINAARRSILLSPSLPDGTKIIRRKRVGDDLIDLIVTRVGERIKVKWSSEKNKSYRVVRVPKLEKIK